MDPNTKNINDLLKKHSINRTAARIEVMRVMTQAGTMLGLFEIVKRMNYRYDRVTIYRILCMFCQKELLYKLVDLQSNTYYRFNRKMTKEDFTKHLHDEVFFKCIDCGEITFIGTPVPEYLLPKGFVKTATNFLISGHCPGCAAMPVAQS